jgi:benzoyl-CoA reductase/2-hydroxyglutaryl-CoA dehydratase subunit BcrC/BadD/HgdB
MTRKEYLAEQKEGKGRGLLGVFPAQYPKEVLWALNVLPVEIWDPPLKISASHAHLPPNTCSIVKHGLELVLQGQGEILDGYLFPHTCDALQNVASLIGHLLSRDKPCYFLYHPREPHRRSSRAYYLAQLKSLVAAMERQFGTLKLDELQARVEQGRHISKLIRDVYDLRARGALRANNVEFYRTIRRGEYLFPDDYILELEGFLSERRGDRDPEQPAIVLSGVVPNPRGILDLLDERKIRVSHDDFINGSRRLLMADPPQDLKDPFEQLTARYFSLPPCSTKAAPAASRRDYLLRLAQETDAQGIIFYVLKYCENEWFDVPILVAELQKRGLPCLVVESEISQQFPAQLGTRVEAFIERVGIL